MKKARKTRKGEEVWLSQTKFY